MKEKRGLWQDHLLPMILGIIILAIVFYFIFNEYFTQDNLGIETCKESTLLRATSPEINEAGFSITQAKDLFPLQCTTQITTINFNDTTKAERLVAETLAQCWYLYLEGEKTLFPSKTGTLQTTCVPCARIRFDEKTQLYYQEHPLNIKKGLEQPLRNTQISGKEYLKEAFKYHIATDWLIGTTDLETTTFPIQGTTLKLNSEEAEWLKGFDGGVGILTLPQYLTPKQGDLIIFFQQTTFRGTEGKEQQLGADSMLFYFQEQQQKPNPYDILGQKFIKSKFRTAKLCDQYDGIPA